MRYYSQLLQRSRSPKVEMYKVESYIRGYHIFSCIWNPTISEQLVRKREVSNAQDVCTVAVMHFLSSLYAFLTNKGNYLVHQKNLSDAISNLSLSSYMCALGTTCVSGQPVNIGEFLFVFSLTFQISPLRLTGSKLLMSSMVQ